LHRHVVNPVSIPDPLGDAGAHVDGVGALFHLHVGHRGVEALGDAPRVKHAHAPNPGRLAHGPSERQHREPVRNALHQHVPRLTQQLNARDRDEHGDPQRDHRVRAEPTERQDERRGDDRPDRPERVRQHMGERGAGVRVVARRSAGENPGGQEIDEEPEHRDRQHRRAVDGPGRAPPLRGLDDDRHRAHEQQHRVAQRSEDLGPTIAEGPLWARRTPRDDPREERKRQRPGVRQHVTGVREQREAVREDSANGLDAEKPQRQQQRESKPLERNVPHAVTVTVTVVVTVIVAVIVIVTVIVVVVVTVIVIVTVIRPAARVGPLWRGR
jgi:hypothetical protein